MSVATPCREGISSETLSTWNDSGLSEAEAARLRAHVAGCPACQARLDSYRTMRLLIAGSRIPPTPPVDVAAVRAARRQARSTNAMRTAGRTRLSRALWGGIGAAVAAALLIAAFSQVFARLSHPTPAATATPKPHHAALVWEQRTLPPGVNLNLNNNSIALSQVTGEDAWICKLESDGRIAIWATTDQARTWNLMTRFNPGATSQPLYRCDLTLDNASTRVLALVVTWGCGECGTLGGATYVSTDAGATWKRLPLGEDIQLLATVNGRTYAEMPNLASKIGGSLQVSSNGLRAWNPAPGVNEGQSPITLLQANLATGELVGSARDNRDHRVWRLKPGATTWTAYTLRSDVNIGFIQWNRATDSWLLCDTSSTFSRDSSNIRLILCTNDFGQTWTTRPPLAQTVTCRDCNKGGTPLVMQTYCPPMGTSADGAFITVCQPAATVSAGQPQVLNLYQLDPGATAWRSLGPPPNTMPNPIPEPPDPSNSGGAPSSPTGLNVAPDPATPSGTVLWYDYPVNGVLAVAILPA